MKNLTTILLTLIVSCIAFTVFLWIADFGSMTIDEKRQEVQDIDGPNAYDLEQNKIFANHEERLRIIEEGQVYESTNN